MKALLGHGVWDESVDNQYWPAKLVWRVSDAEAAWRRGRNR